MGHIFNKLQKFLSHCFFKQFLSTLWGSISMRESVRTLDTVLCAMMLSSLISGIFALSVILRIAMSSCLLIYSVVSDLLTCSLIFILDIMYLISRSFTWTFLNIFNFSLHHVHVFLYLLEQIRKYL